MLEEKVSIKIKKEWEEIFKNINIIERSNNEIEISLSEDNTNLFNLINNNNIEIKFIFDLENLSNDLLLLYFLINWLQKYKPQTISLNLPYLPYTNSNNYEKYFKDNLKEENKLFTNSTFFKLLKHSNVSTIKTYDLINPTIQEYSDIYIENIWKEIIFEEEFNFIKNFQKSLFIITLNEDDNMLFYSKFSDKQNVKIINLSSPINFKNKKEVDSTFLKLIKSNPNVPIYIFDKDLKTWERLYNILKNILKETEVKEISVYITHLLFSKGSYRKFNSLFENYPKVFITFYAPETIKSYFENIDSKYKVIKGIF